MANLVFSITSSATSMQVSDTSGFAVNGGVVSIDSESIQYTTATDRLLVGLTRGVQGTTAASHTAGAAITLLESAPFVPVVHLLEAELMQWPHTMLTDPSAVPSQSVIDSNTMITVVLDNSGSNQSWTLPASASTGARIMCMALTTASTKTLSVNSVSIPAGTAQMFMWDGSAWYAA